MKFIKVVTFILIACVFQNTQAQSFFTGYEGKTNTTSKQKILDTINTLKKNEFKIKIVKLSIQKDSLESYLLHRDYIFNKAKVGYQKELIKAPSKKDLKFYKKYDSIFKKRDTLKYIYEKNLVKFPTTAELNKNYVDSLSIELNKIRDSIRHSKKMPTEQVKKELYFLEKRQNTFYKLMTSKIQHNKEQIDIYKDSLLLLFKKNHRVRHLEKLYNKPKDMPRAYQHPLRDNLVITSEYGYRTHPILKKKHFHYGIDLRGRNKSVYAVLPGIVTKVSYDKKLGIYIVVTHEKGLKTIYGHLSKFYVLEDTIIDLKKPIGLTGSTGSSTAPHLHFSTKLNNKFINPKFLLYGL
ncbi:M23 family metallopeptidase [Tenacibaculum maritimum]|uniref:M23 family metallopeptidase n=1 Tax=Tenacibaculum maritimum TaxID=107401 RepID=UPI0038769DC4